MFFNDKKLKGALIVVTYAIILHFVFMKYSTVFGGLGVLKMIILILQQEKNIQII